MKKPKVSMKLKLDYDREIIANHFRIIPVNFSVKGYMIVGDATKIVDQIQKSAECADKLLERAETPKYKPKDNQYAWVEIDGSGDLEMAQYNKNSDSWSDMGADPGSIENSRVRIHQLIKTPKL